MNYLDRYIQALEDNLRVTQGSDGDQTIERLKKEALDARIEWIKVEGRFEYNSEDHRFCISRPDGEDSDWYLYDQGDFVDNYPTFHAAANEAEFRG